MLKWCVQAPDKAFEFRDVFVKLTFSGWLFHHLSVTRISQPHGCTLQFCFQSEHAIMIQLTQ